MLQNEYLVVKIGVGTAENGPFQVRSPRLGDEFFTARGQPGAQPPAAPGPGRSGARERVRFLRRRDRPHASTVSRSESPPSRRGGRARRADPDAVAPGPVQRLLGGNATRAQRRRVVALHL